ncbi:peroxide stress protein YaaA [Ideonella sp. B7]|uniref:peroxide stress protein YaaA n=1 Tax=Ideonella benzenivorans TaxID=2831643 RepID=UPI001CEDDF2B|nr:peroxide stress protein YaaA [Ideonella benzenivorans]MCA6217898.1 peroxide stress protein YaaA [Ideonella benzenivorans]
MLFLISPAKTLDYETPVPPEVAALASRPRFVKEAATLIDVLKTKSVQEVASLMDLSDPLAQLNVARYGAWSTRFTERNSKPAVLAFNGDVYEGLDAASLSVDDLGWAQQHLVILSGLYGLLRPLDRLQPYRLEMGIPLATPGAKNLYGYWGDRLSRTLNEQLGEGPAPVVVNLASQEYFKAVDRKVLQARVVDCVFEDWKGGRWKVISFHAKRARGLMARFAIQHRITQVAALQGFASEGYGFDAAASDPDRLVFRRKDAA